MDVLVQVIKEADSQYPSDYVQPDSSNLVKDEANVEVDNVFENCDEYTEQFGYECDRSTSAPTGPSSLTAPV